jgi:hypothetical protein
VTCAETGLLPPRNEFSAAIAAIFPQTGFGVRHNCSNFVAAAAAAAITFF